MKAIKRRASGMLLAAATVITLNAQEVVTVGKGSYASYTPLSICRSEYHVPGDWGFQGDQSKYMQYRTLYLHERAGQPIPTNDWWTNLITQPYSGRMWSYPQFVQAQRYGVDVQWPSQWMENGTEMRSNTTVSVKGIGFAPESAVAEHWHDWDVQFAMRDGNKQMYVTMVHGMPFTWVEMKNVVPQISISQSYQRLTDYHNPQVLNDQGNVLNGKVSDVSRFAMRQGNDLYGIYLPEHSTITIDGSTVTADFFGSSQYVVVALIQDISQLATMANEAYNVPRSTKVTWQYDSAQGVMHTRWDVAAENLLKGAGMPGNEEVSTASTEWPVLQGFLPHQYRDTGCDSKLPLTGMTYATPHGKLKMAAGNSFEVDYRFYGMLPYYAVPHENNSQQNAYQKERMRTMLESYTAKGTFGADTYWGGKGLTQMALNMMFAREMGEKELFEECRGKLKEALVNWLTFTPGETNYFFARYDRWGAMVGYSTSYDSETFNDHHFHYGYFTYAAALLAMVDDDFRNNYGEILTLIAKDYANWDHEDGRFPFFRTFDPWAGHSFAGGMGDDNGNGQESSSEAMQGWGGLYLLGVALQNDEMRDAGIFGWLSEARGTAEYWFDRHSEPGRDMNTFHSAESSDEYNIRYDLFRENSTTDGVTTWGAPLPYNSNLTCHGVGWWTYFGYDAIFMQGIQWMPISPALDYLSEDKEFAAWDYARMWKDRRIGGWLQSDRGDHGWPDAGYLGDSGGWGNVALSYLQRSDPAEAARIFDMCWDAGEPECKSYDTNGITYFVTHSHLTYGDLNWSITASVPTARVYEKNGVKTYMAYNPTDQDIDVRFSDGYTLSSVPARRLKVSGYESLDNTTITRDVPEEEDPRATLLMPNLALHCSTTTSGNENDYSMGGDKAVDGDETTRWGSKMTDGQWLTVDLGKDVLLYQVRILWETAYASKYAVEVSDDSAQWTTVQTVNNSGSGWNTVDMGDVRGRYLRVRGITRGHADWGISIFELQAFGQYADANADDLLGIQMTADRDVLRQNEGTQLHARGYTVGKQWKEVNAVWSTTDGTVTSNGVFTPAIYPRAAVTATIGTWSAAKSWAVEEAIFTGYLTLSPRTLQVAVSESTTLTVEGKNQFKEPINVAPETLAWRVCTYSGKNMTDTADGYIDSKEAALTINHSGNYAVIATTGTVSDTIYVECRDYADINLALNKPTVATSKENNQMDGDKATDGNMSTRWGSAVNDDESLTVDLQAIYGINRVKVYWEAARATKYLLQASTDGITWQTITTIENSPANEEVTFAETPARYVRMQGVKRNNVWGYSIWEFEVYGTHKISDAAPTLVDLGADERGVHMLSGAWDESAFAEIDSENGNMLTAYDMNNVQMNDGTSFGTTNPNALIIIDADKNRQVTNSQNVVLKDIDGAYSAHNIQWTDGTPVHSTINMTANDVRYVRTLNGGYTTLSLPFNSTVPEGFSAYCYDRYEKDGDTGNIFFKQVNTLEAGMPYVLYTTEGECKWKTANGEISFVENTINKGEVSMQAVLRWLDDAAYTMTEGDEPELEQTTGGIQFRSIFTLPSGAQPSQFRLLFDGVTGIETIPAGVLPSLVDDVYSIDGRKVRSHGQGIISLPPGIYIINGHKVAVSK